MRRDETRRVSLIAANQGYVMVVSGFQSCIRLVAETRPWKMLSGLRSMSATATRDEISRPVTSQIMANGVVCCPWGAEAGASWLVRSSFLGWCLGCFLDLYAIAASPLFSGLSNNRSSLVLFFTAAGSIFNFYLPYYLAVGVLTEALALFLIAAESRYHPSKRLSLIFFIVLSIQNEFITSMVGHDDGCVDRCGPVDQHT